MASRRLPVSHHAFGPRLTEEDRQAILDAYRQGTSIIKLAAAYGVSKQAISLLARRRGVVNETSALLPTAAEVTLMLHRCGLTKHDAAAFVHNIASGKPVDYRTVYGWTVGTGRPRWEQWKQLLELSERQDRAANEQLTMLRREMEAAGAKQEVTIQVARTQEQAKRFGWPCAGAHLAVVRRVIEHAPKGLHIAVSWSGGGRKKTSAAVGRRKPKDA